jgi:hypothetical protein
LFVQLNQGEINYRDKHEDWGTQKNIWNFGIKTLQKRQIRKHMWRYTGNTKIDLTRSGCVTCGLTEDRVYCNHRTELLYVHTVIRYDHQVRIRIQNQFQQKDQMAVLCLRAIRVTKQVVSVVRSKGHFHREHRRTESTQVVATETTKNTGVTVRKLSLPKTFI